MPSLRALGARVLRFALLSAALLIAPLAACGYGTGSAPTTPGGGTPQLDRVVLPPGFAIEIYAERVDGARSLTIGPAGVVFVGSRDQGRVYALVDADGDFRAETVLTIASGLKSPNGVAWDGQDLYVAEISRVIRFPNLADRLRNPPRREVVNDSFPTEDAHGWKFIAFGPDGLLYVPVGAPCNVCERDDERFASIMRMRPDGSELEIFARGIRNSVGFDWQPDTHVLWFTDNGRDWLGDDAPPDELNRAPAADLHFGFPYCHGNGIVDPDQRGVGCGETTAPAAELEPHAAALGMRFYAGEQFPSEWRSGVFIAQHGSWNRTTPSGYRVAFVPIDGATAGPARVFAEGWLSQGIAWGRPVDVQPLQDGSLLVSDDKAGAVYRIHHDP